MRLHLLPLFLAAAPLAWAANTPTPGPVMAKAPGVPVAPAVPPRSAVPPAPTVAEPSVAPVSWPDGRYSQMVEQSPFALATAPETPVDEHSFADGWKLKGIARLRNESGAEEYFVTIKSADLKDVYSFVGDKPNHEVSVVTVNYSSVVGKSTVVLKKGNETAKIQFDDADVLGAPPAPVQPVPRGGGPGIPGGRATVNTPGGGRQLLVPNNGQPGVKPGGNTGAIPRPNMIPGPQAAPRRIIRTPPAH